MDKIMETAFKLGWFARLFESKLDKARMGFILHDGVQAMFFTSKDGETFEELPMSMQKQDGQMESLQMKTICSDTTIKYAALLFDCETVSVDTEDAHKIKVEDHPEKVDNILLVMYAREGLVSFVRVLPYKKKGDQDYWFGDLGWQEVPASEGLFENVFKGLPK